MPVEKKVKRRHLVIVILMFIGIVHIKTHAQENKIQITNNSTSIETDNEIKIDSILNLLTLEEKVRRRLQWKHRRRRVGVRVWE